MNDEEHKTKILSFYGKERRMPTYSEAMKLFGFKSKNAVFRVFEKLIEAGVVVKDRLGRLQAARALGEVPLLGSVTAGMPRTAEEIFDTLDLEDFLIEKRGSTYMLEVDGDSMIDAHIQDKDMVIAEVANRARVGEIVIANIDGEWTMKYYREKNGKPYLEPANKNFKPLYPKESFSIGAVVRGVVRKY
jgi:SOS regulatory protein LexA